jgi:RNA polymerase sigma-70 factor (ECF subfamily)
MSEPNVFADLIQRVRSGDERAAEELVRRYEPLIRREVRLRLSDWRLARVFDSMDVCQSVLASFFVRTAAGQYDLNGPEQLLRLLVRMTRNKVASAARGQRRQRRDVRREAADGEEALEGVAADAPTPSRVVAGRELLERFRAGLRDEERALADLRAQGLGWEEIAARVGGTPQARRMQLARAAGRVARALGLDEDADGTPG